MKIKELGKNNYKLLGAAVVVAVAAIPLAIANIKAGAGALIADAVLFLLAMLLPAKRAEAVKSAAPAAAAAPSSAPVKAPALPYEVERYTVAGVTFSNGSVQRQDLLRHAYFRDNPFGRGYGVIIRPEQYEGADAVGVYITHEGRDGLGR